MAKKKNWYYVLVLTEHGPSFVTNIGDGKTAYWDKSRKPKPFVKDWADDIAFGLQVNGYNAFMVCMRYELDHQPYRYEMGEFQWVDKKEESKDE